MCPDQETLEAHVNGHLPAEKAGPLDAHLSSCDACFGRQLEFTQSALFPRVPDVHFVREIGRGRFGVVYKSWWHGETRRLVAVKVLSSAGEMETVRFDREIAVLQKLDSPGIVRCWGSGAVADGKFYIMDYVEGVHLDEYLSTRAKNLTEKLAVFRRVCSAVADAHAMGVVHRDLKPRNILVDRDGQPHVLDFGICSVSAPDWTSWARYTITQPGDVIGTLKYMSPEQAWGGASAPISPRSDIWALGIMLFEIVTDGGYPYALGSTPDKPAHEALLDRIRKELPRLPRLPDLENGRDLEVLLERCLAWDPAARLESAQQLAEDIGAINQGRRIRTRPYPLWYRAQRIAVGAASKSPWTFWLLFVAMAGFLVQAGAFVFRIGWEVSGHGKPALGLPSVEGRNVASGDPIVLIGVQDETVPKVLEYAESRGMTGVTSNVTSWRGIHGALMKRLARAKPLAVVWDYYFRSAQPDDEILLEGIRALEAAEVPVILASLNYTPLGEPELSPVLVKGLGPRLRHGAILGRDLISAPGESIIAFSRSEQAVVPGITLTTFAAVSYPQARLELDWAARGQWITLLYVGPNSQYLRDRDRLEHFNAFRSNEHAAGIMSGDLLASMRVSLNPPEFWQSKTIAYHDLLAAQDDELASWVQHRILVIGDMRTKKTNAAPDRHRVRYEQGIVDDVPGCYPLADGIVGMLNQKFIRAAFPLGLLRLSLMLMAAVVGCCIPPVLSARRVIARRKIGLASVGATTLLAGVAAWVAITARSYLAVHGGMTGFALFLAMTGALWVEFARNRHRILDLARQAMDDLHGPSDGTVTLASQPGK